jgi:hypothetical protein
MSEATSRSSTGSKYISNWELTTSDRDPFDDICNDDDLLFSGVDGSIYGEVYRCKNMDFDDAGNTYFVFFDSSTGSIGGYSYTSGINIVKIDTSGNVEYIVNIDYTNSNVIPQMIVVSSEDVFYISFYSYYSSNTFTFTPAIQVTTSATYREVMAYHSSSGWQWAVEAGPAARVPSNSYSTQGNYHWEIASDGSLVTLSYQGRGGQCNYPGGSTDSGYEYRLIKYDITDGSLDWYRTIDTCDANFAKSSNSIFVDGGNIYLYVESTIKITLHGNSQNCDGVVKQRNGVDYSGCQMFARYSNQGQLTWSKTVTHTGVAFTKFNPVSNGILMSGMWGEGVNQNYTNYSGDIHWAPENTGSYELGISIAKLDFNGAWNYHHTWGGDEDDELYYFTRVTWDDDDDFIIAVPFTGTTFEIDSTHDVTRNIGSYGTAIFAYSAAGQFQWSSSLTGTGTPIPYGFAASNSNAMFISFGSVNFGQTYSATDNTIAAAWIGLDNGVWSDFEGNLSIWPVYGVTADGVFLTMGADSSNSQFSTILSWAEDIDADDIPPSDDNCVDDWNPSQSDYDSDGDGDVCDDDDDNDTIPDVVDICPLGELDWTSVEVLDHDGDGCLDQSEEDRDDDNDGLSDQLDLCPVGILGFGNDRDGDGCKDSEDSDDDNDGIHDGSDFCPSGATNWLSGDVTDYDSDGCEDDGEDYDDDGDGVYDSFDDCPRGELGWSSNTNTDFDGDGCLDGVEDEDDDNDGVNNPVDECPNSVGTVDDKGCTVGQGMGGNEGGGGNSSTVIYYVCPGGSAVVLDIADCPEEETPVEEEVSITDDNSSSVNVDENGTISANNIPTGLYLCPDRTALVSNPNDCPLINSDSNTDSFSDSASSEKSSNDNTLVLVAGMLTFGVILLISLLVVSLVRVKEMKAMRESGKYATSLHDESNFEF